MIMKKNYVMKKLTKLENPILKIKRVKKNKLKNLKLKHKNKSKN